MTKKGQAIRIIRMLFVKKHDTRGSKGNRKSKRIYQFFWCTIGIRHLDLEKFKNKKNNFVKLVILWLDTKDKHVLDKK